MMTSRFLNVYHIMAEASHLRYENSRMLFRRQNLVGAAMNDIVRNERHVGDTVEWRDAFQCVGKVHIVFSDRPIKCARKIRVCIVCGNYIASGAVRRTSGWRAFCTTRINERALTAHTAAGGNNRGTFWKAVFVKNRIYNCVGNFHCPGVHPAPWTCEAVTEQRPLFSAFGGVIPGIITGSIHASEARTAVEPRKFQNYRAHRSFQ